MSGLWFVICVPKQAKSKGWKEKTDNEDNDENQHGQINGYISEELKKYSELTNKNLLNQSKSNLTSSHTVINVDNLPLEQILADTLEELDIHDAVWTPDKEDKHYQVYFPCEYGIKSDKVLKTLRGKGFGHLAGTSLGVVPFTLFYREGDQAEKLVKALEHDGNKSQKDPPIEDPKNISKFKALQQRFLKSVSARLTVAQVVHEITDASDLTFDFVCYILAASMVAAMGLMENSAVSLIAAMLVSPLMGPILATTFGFMIRDPKLIIRGFRNGGIGLILCVVFGFIFGAISFNFIPKWNPTIAWPTVEMVNRGVTRCLWSGVLVALPSGVGAGLGILSGNTAPLIGVAISASLLPPAVNCGVFWGYSFLKMIWSLNEAPINFMYDTYNVTLPPALLPPEDYVIQYSPNMCIELALLGLVSVSLTLLNILCIFLMGILILKIKEVAPYTSLASTERFWKHDIRVVRNYNRTLGRLEGKELEKEFLQEWTAISGLDPNKVFSEQPEARRAQVQTIRDIVTEVTNHDEVYKTVVSSLPLTAPYKHNVTWHPQNAYDYPSLYDLGMRDRRSLLQVEEPLKQRRESRVLNWLKGRRKSRDTRSPSKVAAEILDLPLEDEDDEFPDGRRRSTLLRQTLQSAGHRPYSLWPSRFEVTRVEEPENVNSELAGNAGPMPPSSPKKENVEPQVDIVISKF